MLEVFARAAVIEYQITERDKIKQNWKTETNKLTIKCRRTISKLTLLFSSFDVIMCNG